MEINWHGHSCFRITERGMATVVTDPYDHSVVGFGELNLKADIVTISRPDPGHNFTKAVKTADWQIDGPGEYEIGGVFLTAVPTGKQDQNGDGRNMAYAFDFAGVNVAHLGSLKNIPGRKVVDTLGSVDVLLLPVGGGSGLSAAKAAEVVNLIEPGIIIPMHYHTPDSKIKLDGLDPFLKQMGLDSQIEEQASLKVSKRDIPEETRVVVLTYRK